MSQRYFGASVADRPILLCVSLEWKRAREGGREGGREGERGRERARARPRDSAAPAHMRLLGRRFLDLVCQQPAASAPISTERKRMDLQEAPQQSGGLVDLPQLERDTRLRHSRVKVHVHISLKQCMLCAFLQHLSCLLQQLGALCRRRLKSCGTGFLFLAGKSCQR